MSALANERVAWFNGEFMPEREVRIPFRDSSWVYGDGCFDMTRSFHHRLFKVKEHVDRLYRSLKYLRIDPGFGPPRMCALTEELFTPISATLRAWNQGRRHQRVFKPVLYRIVRAPVVNVIKNGDSEQLDLNCSLSPFLDVESFPISLVWRK